VSRRTSEDRKREREGEKRKSGVCVVCVVRGPAGQ